MASTGIAALALATTLLAQDTRHGRKYKAPPVTSHLEILVLRDSNGKVVENAGVVFHPSKDGVDEGNLEVKSGTDGKAFIDIIPTGSVVEVQVISPGFTTYSGELTLDGPSKQMTVRLQRPQKQVTSYGGTVDTRAVGVQEPAHRVTAAPVAPKPIAATDPFIPISLRTTSCGANCERASAPARPKAAILPPGRTREKARS